MDGKITYYKKAKKNINFAKFLKNFKKINKLPDHCICSFAKTYCPIGLPGLKGQDGLPGQKGKKGSIGKPGTDGNALIDILYSSECILCPPGLIGEPGLQGNTGLPGIDGNKFIYFFYIIFLLFYEYKENLGNQKNLEKKA